ncbi:Putative EriC protein [Avibacterium paragallinarum JF4211]|uniref:Chloride channel protein n=1 Tax=Avibacterium paragallinarum TaxID=728 RepID=A0A377I7Y5_AVIPA|nr:Putative EriC protein [Avibacterium paragallinarum JF4211]STO70912.1 chloride channel protein [Avibacterium paragallinarum]
MLKRFTNKIRHFIHRTLRQSYRISRKTLEFSCLLMGAALVSLFSLGFAKLADLGLHWNALWTAKHPYAVWVVLPLGLAFLAWVTAKYTPYVSGSGIPQVIASIDMPYSANKSKLIAFGQTLWKIPLTFLAMLFGASVGREGPSVQVGGSGDVCVGQCLPSPRLGIQRAKRQ